MMRFMFWLGSLNIQFAFICFLYCVKEGGVAANIESEVATLKIVTTMQNAGINFSVKSYCTILFSKEENLKVFEVALAVALCNSVVGCIINLCRYRLGNTANTTSNACLLFEKRKFKPNKRTATTHFRLTSFFFINIDNLWYPILV